MFLIKGSVSKPLTGPGEYHAQRAEIPCKALSTCITIFNNYHIYCLTCACLG